MKKRTWLWSVLEKRLPPNVEPQGACAGITGIGIGGAMVSTVWFLILYSQAYRELFTYDFVSHKSVVIPGAEMRPFTDFAPCAVWLFAFFAFVIAAWAVTLYGSFSQGSRSLYLMQRLPQGKQVLTGYVLRVPLVCLMLAAAVCAVLLGVYYLVWRFATPGICLPR